MNRWSLHFFVTECHHGKMTQNFPLKHQLDVFLYRTPEVYLSHPAHPAIQPPGKAFGPFNPCSTLRQSHWEENLRQHLLGKPPTKEGNASQISETCSFRMLLSYLRESHLSHKKGQREPMRYPTLRPKVKNTWQTNLNHGRFVFGGTFANLTTDFWSTIWNLELTM